MSGFLRGFFALTTFSGSSTTGVISTAAQKAVELAMLGQIDEASAIFAILAQHHRSEHAEERDNRPFNQSIPRVTPFLYEIFETLPPGVGEVDKLNGEDELQRLEEQFLREIRPSLGPRKGIDITRNATEADFEKLNSLVKKTLESGDPHLNAMTGASVRLSLFVLPTSIIDHKKNNEANRDTGIISLERPSWPSKYLFVPQQNR
jgi:hypothetical protein